MDESEIFSSLKTMIDQNLHANVIRDNIRELSPEILEKLNAIPRENIRKFVSECSKNFNLGKVVADIGCGYRTNREELLDKYTGNIRYIGIDYIDRFKNNYENNNIEFILGDAMDIPLLDNTISTVISTECLEHIYDDKKALSEMSRILQPDGILILTVPGRDIPNHEKLPYQFDYRRYTIDNLENLLLNNKFKDIEIDEIFYMGFSVNIMCTAKLK
jgi:SAM-dependent methyltransferase